MFAFVQIIKEVCTLVLVRKVEESIWMLMSIYTCSLIDPKNHHGGGQNAKKQKQERLHNSTSQTKD